MSRTRVKICGITRSADAIAAAALGADAIGLVFYPPSPRYVEIPTAQRIVAALPPFVSVVGLFVNPQALEVQNLLAALRIDVLQFHGAEVPAFCEQFAKPYIKAVPMGAGASVAEYAQTFSSAAALLLDSHGADKMGGTGKCFDWAHIPQHCAKPLILAGGLHAGNVAEAVRQVRPYAVDVSSGVESAKGIKDVARMREFLRGVYAGHA